VADDFLFDESGARIGADHSEEPPAGAEQATPTAAAGEGTEPTAKRPRAARKLQILTQSPGTESGCEGVMRTEEQHARRPGMFSANKYFWLYYAAAGVRGLTERVAVGTVAEKGQYHAILDDTVDVDADSIPGSNTTYEFVGSDANRPELLYTRIYPCVCRVCREPSAVSAEHASCPHISTVGKYVQQTIHEATGITRQRQVQKAKTEVFARGIQLDGPSPGLYAAYASYEERGARKYWLLKIAKPPYKARRAIKVAGGATIKTGTLVVDAQWYLSTSDSQERKSYTLLDETVSVPVASLVQEHELAWDRNFRAPGAELTLSVEAHARLMCHNYSNTK